VTRICYVLLSPTLGMHQYTADLANRMVRAGHQVSLVTTRHYPRDRYLPDVRVRTPVDTQDTGFSADALRFSGARAGRAGRSGIVVGRVAAAGGRGAQPHQMYDRLAGAIDEAATPRIQELHITAWHAICGVVDEAFS